MKSLKLIILSGILFVFVVTLLFFNILYDYRQQRKIIQRELIGIKKIIFLHDLNLSLKVLRGLTQLKTGSRKKIKKILMIDENKVYKKLQELNDKSLGNFFKTINTYNYQDSIKLFNQYTWLIKKIDIIRLETSEKYFLFFEHNRKSYYLMVLFSSKIPEAIEYLGRIRGLTTGVLSGKSDYNNVGIRIEININNFLNKVSEIKYFISKLSVEKATLLNEQLTLAMSNFYKLQNEIKKIPGNKCELKPEDFFLSASKLINNFNNLFILTEKILEKIDELYQKIENIEHEILLMKSEYVKQNLSRFGVVEEYHDNIYRNSIGYKVKIKGNTLYIALINNGKRVRIIIVQQNDELSTIIEEMWFEGFMKDNPMYSIIIPFNQLRDFFEKLEKTVR